MAQPSPIPGGSELQVIGVDIGGSGVRMAVVDGGTGAIQGEVLRTGHGTTTPAEDILLDMRRMLDSLPSHDAVGIGFPGVVAGTRIRTAPNLRSTWPGTDLAQALDLENIVLLNDADAAALAEVEAGAGQGEQGTVLTLTIGTGIGTAVHRSGVLVPNLELGHLLHPDGGTVESRVRGALLSGGDLSLDAWSKRLQSVLDLYEAWLDPDVIILGGGITERWSEWGPELRSRATVRRAYWGPNAGLIGAAIAAHQAFS